MVPPTPSDQAASALVRIGAPAVEPLITALGDERPVLRGNAACVLGWISDVRAAGPVSALVKDADPYVRVCAATALGGIADPAALDGLIAALADEDEDTRMTAAMGLGQKKNERAVDALLEAFDRVFPATAYALGETRSPRAVDWLIPRLEDPHTIVVIQALGEIGEARAVSPLLTLLKDRQVRSAVAEALGKLGDPRAVGPLIECLKDENRWCDGPIALALKRIAAPDTVERLVRALDSRDVNRQRGATVALGAVGAVEPLTEALRKPDAEVRRLAAILLMHLKDPETTDPLIDALQDESEAVRLYAAEALKAITGQDFGQDHARWAAWREVGQTLPAP